LADRVDPCRICEGQNHHLLHPIKIAQSLDPCQEELIDDTQGSFEEAFPDVSNPFRSSDDAADDLVESQRGSQEEYGMSRIHVDDPRMSKLRLYIDDCRQVTFFKILQDLRNNHQVTKLNVCRRGGEKGSNLRSRNDLALRYETIHTLPNV
jgi:hypothetical protein